VHTLVACTTKGEGGRESATHTVCLAEAEAEAEVHDTSVTLLPTSCLSLLLLHGQEETDTHSGAKQGSWGTLSPPHTHTHTPFAMDSTSHYHYQHTLTLHATAASSFSTSISSP
jgi:hypothetical protein